MLKVKGSIAIAALTVVAGGATALVGNGRPPYAITAPESANSAQQSTADRFRLEVAPAKIPARGDVLRTSRKVDSLQARAVRRA